MRVGYLNQTNFAHKQASTRCSDPSLKFAFHKQVYGEDGPQRFEARKDLRLLCAEVALGYACREYSHLLSRTV